MENGTVPAGTWPASGHSNGTGCVYTAVKTARASSWTFITSFRFEYSASYPDSR